MFGKYIKMEKEEIIARFDEDALIKKRRKEEFKKKHYPNFDERDKWDRGCLNNDFRDSERKHKKLALFLEYVLDIFIPR